MSRKTLVLNFLLIITTKFILANFQDNSIDEEAYHRKFYLTIVDDSKCTDKIWVLDLNDGGLETLKLREANEEDVEDFEFYTQPLIDNFNNNHNVVKKDSPKPTKPDALDVKKTGPKKSTSKEDIFKYLNKFAMYSKTESDAYLSDAHESDDPGIALYFKGRFTSLIVKQGIRQWHYFIPPPSILPAWFSEAHDAQDPHTLEVPQHVADKFYPALFRLLQALLRYPV